MPKLVYVAQTPDSLAAIADEIVTVAENVRYVAELARSAKLTKPLQVPNASILKRAMDDLDAFANGVRKAVRDAKRARGDFVAPEQGPETPPLKLRRGKGN